MAVNCVCTCVCVCVCVCVCPQVCEAQHQFASRTPLPVFGGTKGPDIRKSLLDIQDSFQRLVTTLSRLEYDILDVKATR